MCDVPNSIIIKLKTVPMPINESVASVVTIYLEENYPDHLSNIENHHGAALNQEQFNNVETKIFYDPDLY